MPLLFTPLRLRDVELRNRIAVSPMCMYSSEDGFANDWHFVHLGSRAVGGAGLVFTEAAAVEPRGRISPWDLGIYRDAHVEKLRHITGFIKQHGATPGIQLAHAGRKASTRRPWEGRGTVPPEEGGWTPLAPSPIPFGAHPAPPTGPSGPLPLTPYPLPTEATTADLQSILAAFGAATQRALAAGFEVIELHAAHGYLLHQFLSPLSNHRTDDYGGSFENRSRLLHQTVQAIREHWPERYPLFVRISCTDWADGGWTLDDSVRLAKTLAPLGVDLVDCSSGGTIPNPDIPTGPGYQTAFAETIKREANIPTGAVGLITSPHQAEHILRTNQADLILLARALLRNPHWPQQAAEDLGASPQPPIQYARAW